LVSESIFFYFAHLWCGSECNSCLAEMGTDPGFGYICRIRI